MQGFSEILCMAWRQDNWGPHDSDEVSPVQALRPLSASWPCSTHLPFAACMMPTCPSRHLEHLGIPCVMLTEGYAARLSMCVLNVQVINLFNVTTQNFPDAEIQVSTLDAYFELLIAQAPKLKLPVVTGEIGDSWIYGQPSYGIENWTACSHSCCGGNPLIWPLTEHCIQGCKAVQQGTSGAC